MRTKFARMTTDDREAVIDIFNHYIENSFAAYPEKRLPYEAFGMLLNMSHGYPNATARTETDGISCFIRPGHTGRGDRSSAPEPSDRRRQGEGDHQHSREHLIAQRGQYQVPSQERLRRVRKALWDRRNTSICKGGVVMRPVIVQSGRFVKDALADRKTC